MSNDTELSFAGWVRNQIIHNPEITLDELKAAFDGTDFPKKNKPKHMQTIYQARTSIKQRWGMEPQELPRNTDGSLNMSGMIRLFIDMKGDDSTEKSARDYFATDGLEVKTGTFSNAKSVYLKKKNQPTSTVSELEPEQDTTPRARFVSNKGKKPGKRNRKRTRRNAKSGDVTELLMDTKEYIERVGGVDNARVLMNFVEEIQALPK